MKRKILAAVLAAAIACLASCSGGESTTTTQKSAVSETEPAPAKTATASEMTSSVLIDVKINSALEKSIDDIPYYFDTLDTTGVVDSSYYLCASGAYPDEIAVFKFSSEALAEEGLEAVKERMELQRSTYETYTPAEMYKFDDAVAKTVGCYVVYIVTSDNAKAEEIIDGYIG